SRHVWMREMTVMPFGTGKSRDGYSIWNSISTKAGRDLHNDLFRRACLVPFQEEYSRPSGINLFGDVIPDLHIINGAAGRPFGDANTVRLVRLAGRILDFRDNKSRIVRELELDRIAKSYVFPEDRIAVIPGDGDRCLQTGNGESTINFG